MSRAPSVILTFETESKTADLRERMEALQVRQAAELLELRTRHAVELSKLMEEYDEPD